MAAAVVVAGAAEVEDSAKADGDRVVTAAVTAVAIAREDTAAATMDMDTTITVVVGTEVTAAATTTVDTVISLNIIKISGRIGVRCQLLSRFLPLFFSCVLFSSKKK